MAEHPLMADVLDAQLLVSHFWFAPGIFVMFRERPSLLMGTLCLWQLME